MVREKKRRRKPNCTNMKLHSKDNIRKKPFRFFKIILPSLLHKHRLRIPDKFAENISQKLSKFVTLKIPSGLSWKIALSQTDNKSYLTQGWADFLEDNDIKYGYFLEFEYYGNNHFKVCIFDLTCCEIDYPTEYNCYHVEEENFQNEEHVEVMEDVEVYEDEENEEIQSCDTFHTYKSKNPSFTLTLRKVFKNYCHIPSSFAKEHLNGSSLKFVKLHVEKGGVWHLGCCHDRHAMRITKGWWRFVDDNNWGEGESYTFMLVAKERTSATFEVFKERVCA